MIVRVVVVLLAASAGVRPPDRTLPGWLFHRWGPV